ncbi:hypothetical protein CGQ24_13895 [Arthrobacter sp. 7749]|nr:hypothetical protein CGQ24_13895 [Arthrobacter sp. 7749]
MWAAVRVLVVATTSKPPQVEAGNRPTTSFPEPDMSVRCIVAYAFKNGWSLGDDVHMSAEENNVEIATSFQINLED